MSQINGGSLRLVRKLLWRDWKSGELNLLLISLLLAVATVTSISLFTSRIHNSIYDEASTFLAADAKIGGPIPQNESWERLAKEHQLDTANIIYFRAMAFANEEMLLTQVKAVSDGYPLKGQLTISEVPYQTSHTTPDGPLPGEAWVAPRVFDALDLKPGQTLSIGEADFIVRASLNKEPDAGQSLFGVAPRVMIHIDDVDKTGAVQLGSRVGYDLLIAGDSTKLADLKTLIDPELGEHFRWTDVKDENRSVGGALTRAERFLLLTGCLSVVLSGVAIALAARRYAKRQHNQVAILKTLGVTPQRLVSLYTLSLLAIGLISIGLGAFIGWFLHWGILSALGNLMPRDLAAPSLSAYSTGGITGFIALWAFAAPPIFALRAIAPASILRQDENKELSASISTAIGAVAIVCLMYLYSNDIVLTLIVSAGATLCFAGVGVLSSGLIFITKKIGSRLSYSWRLGLANLKRHQKFNALQIMIFAVLLLLLFVLVTVRTSLLKQWQERIPEGTPNHFVFNIFPDETPGVKAFLEKEKVEHQTFYPMTRGRVVQVNDITSEEFLKNPKNNFNYRRELNLTWSDVYSEDNKIVQGDWWSKTNPSNEMLISVEEEYAEGIDIQLNDTLTFSIAGQELTARVASIRTVQWDSMNPNFFIIFNKPILDGAGSNWVTSFHLEASQKPLLTRLSREFPTISIIEIDQTIEQIQSIIGKVSLAIEFILMLVLASGFLVLITSIQATLDLRIKESAIFRTLGANKTLVRRTLIIEFATLGFLAGVLAVMGSELTLYFLQTRVFNLVYEPQPVLWVLGPLVSTSLIATVGWMSTRSVVITPPLNVLRNLH